LIGAIAGDIIGSVNEFNSIKTEDFPLFSPESTFTDDTVMTIDVTCQGSVPQSIIAFLESSSYEDAVRKAISLGGDSDTQACITGGIAQAFYQTIPGNIIEESRNRLDKALLVIVDRFNARYGHLYKVK
jgi:ADP-ribosylglycohydrolase